MGMDHVQHLAGSRHDHAQIVDQPSDLLDGEASIDDNAVQISADGTKNSASPSSTVGTSKNILDVEKGATTSVESPEYRYV